MASNKVISWDHPEDPQKLFQLEVRDYSDRIIGFDLFAYRDGNRIGQVFADMSGPAAIELRDYLNTLDLSEPKRLGDIRQAIASLPDSTLVEDIDLGKLECE